MWWQLRVNMEPFRSSLFAGLTLLFLGTLLPATVRGQGDTTQPIPTTSPRPTECPALVQYAHTYSNCETFGNCSGALCHLEQFLENYNATVLVEEKCADPVMVEMNIDVPSPQHSHRFSVGGDGLRYVSNDSSPVVADYGRNASHLSYSAMMFVDGDQAMRLIPLLTVPLFPGACMCQSMQQIADVVDSASIGFLFFAIQKSCSVRSDCQGINCNITIPTIGHYVADIMIDPCGESVTFIAFDVNNNASQFHRVFHDSGTYPFTVEGINLHGSLIVGMVHHNYSMDLSVKLQTSADLPIEDILPFHKIILDRSSCSNLTYYYNNGSGSTGEPTIAPPTTAPPTTAMPTQSTKCPYLYVGTRESTNCDLSVNCTVVTCPAQSDTLPETTFAVNQVCADPVMVDFGVRGQVSRYMYSVGTDGLESMVWVNNAHVKAEYGRNTTHIHFKVGESPSVLFPIVQFPLFPGSCMCDSMDNIVKSTNMNSVPGPVGNFLTRTCSTRPDCKGINCDISIRGVPDNTAQVIIDPCQESVRVVISNSSNSILFDETYEHAGKYPLQLSSGLPKMSLYVGIDNYNFSMKLNMTLSIPGVSQDVTLISTQKIILDRSNCSNLTFYSDHPPTSSGSSSGGSGSNPSQPPPNGHSQHQVSLAVVVGVPMGILILLAVTLLIAIVMVLALWRIRKRRRAYSFQRMAFTELDEDDKE